MPKGQVLKSTFTKAKPCLYRMNCWETKINLKFHSKKLIMITVLLLKILVDPFLKLDIKGQELKFLSIANCSLNEAPAKLNKHSL